MVTIRLFASLREATNQPEFELELPPDATVESIFQGLVTRYPQLAPFRRSLLVAVNEEYSDWKRPINEGDEVAFFPPVSGG